MEVEKLTTQQWWYPGKQIHGCVKVCCNPKHDMF